VQDYFEKFRDGRSWDIKVQFYLNANGLLAKCFKHNVRVSEGTLRAFMCGFTQAELGPLIDIVDIGEDAEKACRKVESSWNSKALLLILLTGIVRLIPSFRKQRSLPTDPLRLLSQ